MSVSVVIPTLNEERNIGPLTAELLRQGAREVIVADGGSLDRTAETAQSAGATVVAGPPGRGPQLNAGAARAVGSVLLFLHADVRLPDGAIEAVSLAMSGGNCTGGAFSVGIDSKRLPLRFTFAVADVRSRLLKLPYGDQGIFVSRAAFDVLGGFKNIPIMEDVDFVRRLNRKGSVRILPQIVVTSARRYQREGAVFTSLRNLLLLTLFLAGVEPRLLAKFYPHVR